MDRIDCILDNDEKKQGKRLYGTGLMVKSPRILKNEKNVAVIDFMGSYSDEIADDILNNINPNVEVWTEKSIVY